MSDAENQQKLLETLSSPAYFPHPADSVERIETHISTVLLVGDYAYKFKKPLDLGFLNFATLADRKHYCEEELRLNKRLAPELYLEVVALTGTAADPAFNGTGEAIEYAVTMQRFDQDALLSEYIQSDRLDINWMPGIASQIAQFHDQAAIATADQHYGDPATAFFPMQQNFDQLRGLISDADALRQLDGLEQWTQQAFERYKPLMAKRKADGCIRECHGDMHLGNMARIDGEINVFDGIEFNADFRWIDTISEVAFFMMDMDHRHASAFGWRFLNHYLHISGDYTALELLRFYQVYRAMVRAKVSSIRLGQGNLSAAEEQRIMDDYRGFTALAERYTKSEKPQVILMNGVSGSGKSTVARQLAAQLGAVHISSDSERKRLFGLQQTESSRSQLNEDLYSSDTTDRVYAQLLDRAQQLSAWGFTVVVDATFLSAHRRAAFLERGDAIVVSMQADADSLKQRITERLERGGDPSEANMEVLQQQLAHNEPVTETERVIHCSEFSAKLVSSIQSMDT